MILDFNSVFLVSGNAYWTMYLSSLLNIYSTLVALILLLDVKACVNDYLSFSLNDTIVYLVCLRTDWLTDKPIILYYYK